MSFLTNGTTSTILIVVAQRESLVQAFRKAGAVSGDKAMTLESLGLQSDDMIESLIREGVIVKVNNALHYLDEVRLQENVTRSSIFFLSACGILVAVFLLIFLIARSLA